MAVSQVSVSVNTRHIKMATTIRMTERIRDRRSILFSSMSGATMGTISRVMFITEVCTPELVVDIIVAKTSAAKRAISTVGSCPMNQAVAPLPTSGLMERMARPIYTAHTKLSALAKAESSRDLLTFFSSSMAQTRWK